MGFGNLIEAFRFGFPECMKAKVYWKSSKLLIRITSDYHGSNLAIYRLHTFKFNFR